MKTFTLQQVRDDAAAVLNACDRESAIRITTPDGKSYLVKRVPSDSTKLSSKKTIGDWKAIRNTLAGAKSEVWEGVLTDFYFDRLKTRYLDPIEAIRKNPSISKQQGEGFAIVAIQCSLIEFLESCLQGANYKFDNPAPPHEYKDSAQMFVSFLTNRQPFAKYFDKHLAKDFYKSVRCGMLHEARTKGTWLIKEKSKASVIVDPNGPIMFRDNFQEALAQFIEGYRADVPKSAELQKAFIRKFDYLCT